MPRKELEKIYDPSTVEDVWYSIWESSETFKPSMESSGETFTISIPPPNVTGILTMGHVLNNTIQDVLIRRARMQGKNTLWLPGTDHASIATEAKVTHMLREKKIQKREIGREKFLEHAWDWKNTYGGIIIKQLKKLGCSCDWDREVFTMDNQYGMAVLEAFVRLFNDGLIYRGERIINWDPVGLTALSDEEVIYKETEGHLWYFKYPIKDSNDHLVVATTRPETMLGDTGVAVNPKDKRFKHLIGKTVLLPIVNREIPIFSDDFVDMEFGTGCVKVTPAHDPNDFEMGQRHNLDLINIFYPNAVLNDNVPEQFRNIDRYKARDIVVKELEKLGLLEKIEDYIHSIGHSERTDAVVEPYMSKQWFLKMKPLADMALKAVAEKEIQFFPERWEKTYNHWLKNIRDWCISRQLWWGHQIPVWYRGDEIYCGIIPPEGKDWVRDEDVLDTWFSSWLWPFATLGWPDNTEDMKNFFPTQDLVTGPDIIFFWVARMIMASKYFLSDIPFSHVFFTGIIRDDQGRKMSKSLGNSPDPLDLISKYGADAIRVGLLMIAPQGLDILFSEDRIEQGRNFMNKLWNSARFVLMNLDDEQSSTREEISRETLDETDLWIISRLNQTIKNVDEAYDKYRMNDAVKLVYDFVWGDFCDWYIEFTKTRFYGNDPSKKQTAQSVSIHVLKSILKLLHPYTPFITEEIWSHFKNDNEPLLIKSDWPSSKTEWISDQVEQEMQITMDIISSIRNIRTNLNVSPGKECSIYIRGNSDRTKIIESHRDYIFRLAKVNELTCGVKLEKPTQSATSVVQQMELFIPLEGLIDFDIEIKRLEKQIDGMKGRFQAVNRKLDNKNFVDRAPQNVVEHEKAKKIEYEDSLKKLQKNLASLQK